MESVSIPGAIIIEGHVQGLSNVRSLGEAGIPVYVVDKDKCIASQSRYCRKFFQCPDYQSDEFADFLLKLAEKESIRGWVLIPSNDHAVYTLSRNKEKLEEYFKVITPELDIIEKIYDKKQLLLLAEQCKVPVPKTMYFQSKDDLKHDSLTFPVLTKGRYGLSFYKKLGKKAFLADNETELKEQLTIIGKDYDVSKTFTQELIPFDGTNKTISFTAFCDKGEIKAYWMGIKLREHPIRFGTATYAQSVRVDECYNQSVPFLKALNYTGVCEVEYLLDPRDHKYKLIEINARTWLWVGLAKACGVDYAKLIYDFVNEEEVKYPTTYRIGLYWINPLTDFVFSVLAILKFKLNIMTYLSSLFNHNINALKYKKDNRPYYAYFFKSFFFLKNR